MPYQPPRHFLLRRQTEAITDKDLAFLGQALSIQLAECAASYGLACPGVTLVTPDTHLPSTEAVGIDFVDDDGLEHAAAHHGWNPGAGFPWALVGVKESWSWTQAASHEALEALVNLRLDRWVDGPGGTWAMEICDPVEEDSYEIPVALFGESRRVRVSNWVRPEFWELGGPDVYDCMGILTGPFSLSAGGYALVERSGVVQPLGASQSRRHGNQAKARATSRVAALRGGPQG